MPALAPPAPVSPAAAPSPAAVPVAPAAPSPAGSGPGRYTAVMGTAMVAGAGASLGAGPPGLTVLAEGFWLLSLLALTALAGTGAVRLLRGRAAGRRPAQAAGPASLVLHGCPPMAVLSVGYATLVTGAPLLGPRAAVALDLVLWPAGALYASVVAAAVPYLLITGRPAAVPRPGPTWLLPVVAPLVAASTGPALLPHLPAAARPTLVYGCGGLLGAGLLGVLLVLPVVLAGLLHGGLEPAAAPTLFLVLGPLGQSATAAGALADAVAAAGPARAEPGRALSGLSGLSVLYGVLVLGFALLWLCVAAAANLWWARRSGLPFGTAWWAFTFPVGTLVTGASGLARHTGAPAFTVLAGAMYVLLLGGWAAVGPRTAAGLVAGVLRRAGA